MDDKITGILTGGLTGAGIKFAAFLCYVELNLRRVQTPIYPAFETLAKNIKLEVSQADVIVINAPILS